MWVTVSRKQWGSLRHFVLSGYTRRRVYRAALAAPGAMRVDLAGQPVAPVSPED